MVHAVRQHFDFDEYLALEELSTVRHEFLNGMVWAMAGGSPDHARIAANLAGLLTAALADQPCAVFSSDLRVRVRATGLATYPDLTVVCGQLELDPEDPKQHTVLNPRLVIEVLSPSTEEYDRGEKLEHYRKIPSLQEVWLIAYDTQRIDLWHKTESGWKCTATTQGEVASACVGSLTLADIYRNPLKK